MPSFFNDGNTPARSDGMWKIEQKILGALNGIVAMGGGGGLAGSGSPEGVVTATPGAVYTDYTNHAQWNKETGVGNTGWVQYV